ncbi:MarR family transcriptional regulator [Roseateles koreensis]|uniref:MarR family transcriptional regulator n=1 Tax=Roseateles koreensis TaxID=2987526 RepID=UPI002358B49F
MVTDQVFEARIAKKLKLRKVELTALVLVAQNEGLTAAQLAVALAFTPANMAAWIDRLVRAGLVDRERHLNDGRALHIRTTAEGRALVERATKEISEGEAQALSGLTHVERLMLMELLHKVAACRLTR